MNNEISVHDCVTVGMAAIRWAPKGLAHAGVQNQEPRKTSILFGRKRGSVIP
jgi:hypothetical protein